MTFTDSFARVFCRRVLLSAALLVPALVLSSTGSDGTTSTLSNVVSKTIE
jgi:hypothetical protein